MGWGRRVARVARAGAMTGRWVTEGGGLAYHGWLTIGGDGRASAGRLEGPCELRRPTDDG